MIRPGETVIHCDNAHLYEEPVVGGEQKKRGLIPRDYSIHPVGFYRNIKPYHAVDMATIPQGEWSERLKDKIAQKANLSDLRNVGNYGDQIPSIDQNGRGYCFMPGTLVSLANGTSKPIEEFVGGEMVVSHTNTPRKVIRPTSRNYTGVMVQPRFHGYQRWPWTTSDHKFLTSSGDWVPVVELGGKEVATSDGNKRLHDNMNQKMVDNQIVHCLEVEEDRSFLAEGFKVHNCWAHSGVSAHLLARAVMNEPYVGLSAYAIACIIKSYRDEGGWGAQGVDFQTERGVPSYAFWAAQSMSRSNDNPATWANAAMHKMIEGWVDLQAAQYDRNLSQAQYATCWLLNHPTINDYNWWGHSVCGSDLVDGVSSFNAGLLRENGKLVSLEDFDRQWCMNEGTVGAGFGCRIWNSWGDEWEQKGMGVLASSKAWPDGGVGLRVVSASQT